MENIISDYKIVNTISQKDGFKLFQVENIYNESDLKSMIEISYPSKREYNKIYKLANGDERLLNKVIEKKVINLVNEIQVLSEILGKEFQNFIETQNVVATKKRNSYQYKILLLTEESVPLREYVSYHSFTINDLINLSLDLLKAINSFRKVGLTFCDINIDNILVTPEGTFKLANTFLKEMMGTSEYYIEDTLYLTPKSYKNNQDLYALGILLYELLNENRKPFILSYKPNPSRIEIESAAQLLENSQLPPKALHSISSLNNIINKLLSPNNLGYNSSFKLKKELEELRRSLSVEELDLNLTKNIPVKPNKNSDYLDTYIDNTINKIEKSKTIEKPEKSLSKIDKFANRLNYLFYTAIVALILLIMFFLSLGKDSKFSHHNSINNEKYISQIESNLNIFNSYYNIDKILKIENNTIN